MPVVLDGVVGAAGEEARDERPLVAVGAMHPHEPDFLLVRVRPPIDSQDQLVEPPQPVALPCMKQSRHPPDPSIKMGFFQSGRM
jgi:hypothetical protein